MIFRLLFIAAMTFGTMTTTPPVQATDDDRVVYISHKRAHRIMTQGIHPKCKYEDGSGQRRTCVWDARHMGNGEGRSFLSITPKR